jgi:anti-anti-sigma regulatory factor
MPAMTIGPVLYDDGILRITRTGWPPVLALVGEIDESVYPGLVSALGEFTGEGHCDIHVDLAGVEYCDLAGLRAVVLLAGASDHCPDGRRVVLHAIAPQLRRVLSILGWDSTAGLALDELPAGPPPAGLTVASRPDSKADQWH